MRRRTLSRLVAVATTAGMLAVVPLVGTAGATPKPGVLSTITFVKAVCAEYSSIVGNVAAAELDDTGGRYVDFAPGDPATPVTTAEIPDECHRAEGWTFVVSRDQAGDHHVGSFTTGADGSVTWQLDLTDHLWAHAGKFWVREVTQDGYGFGALRCHTDARHGDNLEWVSLSGLREDATCIAYNVALGDDDEDPKDEDPKDEDAKDEDAKDEDAKDEDPKDEDPKDEDPKDEDPVVEPEGDVVPTEVSSESWVRTDAGETVGDETTGDDAPAEVLSAGATAGDAEGTGATLPFTGSSPWGLVVVATLALGTGLVLRAGERWSQRRSVDA